MAEFGKWISVEEELPKELDEYLIYGTFSFTPDHVDDPCEYDDVDIACYSPTKDMWFSKDSGLEKVKYWMELPNPPTEGGDKDEF